MQAFKLPQEAASLAPWLAIYRQVAVAGNASLDEVLVQTVSATLTAVANNRWTSCFARHDMHACINQDTGEKRTQLSWLPL